MTYQSIEKPSLESLAHHGVLGMKWGHHKTESSSAGASRPSNRELNKASRAKDKAANKSEKQVFDKNWDNSIDAARARTRNSRGTIKRAKTKFQAEKQTLGTREARKNLRAVKDRVRTDREIAGLAKSGKETTAVILGAVGAVAITTILHVAEARR